MGRVSLVDFLDESSDISGLTDIQILALQRLRDDKDRLDRMGMRARRYYGGSNANARSVHKVIYNNTGYLFRK